MLVLLKKWVYLYVQITGYLHTRYIGVFWSRLSSWDDQNCPDFWRSLLIMPYFICLKAFIAIPINGWRRDKIKWASIWFAPRPEIVEEHETMEKVELIKPCTSDKFPSALFYLSLFQTEIIIYMARSLFYIFDILLKGFHSEKKDISSKTLH